MRQDVIAKTAPAPVTPVLTDYEKACAEFSWAAARERLAGLPHGGLNIGYEAVDRHVAEDRGDRVALRCVRRDGTAESVSYAALARLTNRFAQVLRSLGVDRGDRVFTLLGRCPELFTVVLGTFRNTSVLCPLFPAFGPDPVAQRMRWATPASWSPPSSCTCARSPRCGTACPDSSMP